MQKRKHLFAIVFIAHLVYQSTYLVQEFLYTFDACSTSCNLTFKRSHKHLIGPKCIRTVFADHIIRIDDIVPSLGHFSAIFSQYQAHSIQFLKRLACTHDTDVIQELMPKTSVDQVSRCMFKTSHIDIDLSSIFFFILAYECFVIVWIHITKPVSR